jgi:hypothetical protein
MARRDEAERIFFLAAGHFLVLAGALAVISTAAGNPSRDDGAGAFLGFRVFLLGMLLLTLFPLAHKIVVVVAAVADRAVGLACSWRLDRSCACR